MFKALLSVLIPIWVTTIVGVALLALRFYLREGQASRRAPAGRPVDPAEMAGAAGKPALGKRGQLEPADAEETGTLPSRPFIVLPGRRRKGGKRHRRRRRSRRRHLLVR